MKSISMLLLMSLLAGCASTRTPYTQRQRVAIGHAIVGQSLDVVTTSMALSDDRMAEANGIWWNPEDAGSILAGKLVLLGGGWLLGEAVPSWREPIWWVLGISGYGFATWNTYQMIEHDVDPWKGDE